MNETWIDFILGSIIGVAAWFFGGMDGFIKVLVAMSVVDYFSGVSVAGVEGHINSRIGLKGILKKCIMFCLVGVANLMDKTFLQDSDAIRTAVVLFYISNEGISIMENAYRLGVPFPKVLRDKFEQLRDKEIDEDKAQEEVKNDGSSRESVENSSKGPVS